MTTYNLDRDYLEACSSVVAQEDLTAIRNLLDNEDTSAAFDDMLCAAAYHGHLEIIKFLISRGADVNPNEDAESALLVAVRGAKAETTQLLMIIALTYMPNYRDVRRLSIRQS
jgi:ankyrin repeat protein